MRLMVEPDAKPVAHQSPVPVQIHWQEVVKAGHDQDVRLGVIEPALIREPVTWCHRMVICAKKNRKSRRMVDFQPLNVHATRETHHTLLTIPSSETCPSWHKEIGLRRLEWIPQCSHSPR